MVKYTIFIKVILFNSKYIDIQLKLNICIFILYWLQYPSLAS